LCRPFAQKLPRLFARQLMRPHSFGGVPLPAGRKAFSPDTFLIKTMRSSGFRFFGRLFGLA